MLVLSATAPVTPVAAASKVKWFGVNACKGHVACKKASNACKGQNACKGKGWTHLQGTNIISSAATSERNRTIWLKSAFNAV